MTIFASHCGREVQSEKRVIEKFKDVTARVNRHPKSRDEKRGLNRKLPKTRGELIHVGKTIRMTVANRASVKHGLKEENPHDGHIAGRNINLRWRE